MGAWIEILVRTRHASTSCVAPHMGAWIEIYQSVGNQTTSNVAPHMGAWIEISLFHLIFSISKSHPTWVRGLKYVLLLFIKSPAVCRTLHGCVDWNLHSSAIQYRYPVAPYTGAWIEILTTRNLGLNLESRTLHGCVDWNIWRYSNYITWFRRTLHGCVDWNSHPFRTLDDLSSRTLHGCVDWNNIY